MLSYAAESHEKEKSLALTTKRLCQNHKHRGDLPLQPLSAQ